MKLRKNKEREPRSRRWLWSGPACLAAALCCGAPAEARPRWTAAAAKDWYARQQWLVGANYVPSTAINQLEMWQAQTWDPRRIDQELGWAQRSGMNTMRVFLHDRLWDDDPQGFRRRIDAFLTIASRHGIKPLFVLFDSCWDPDPKLGPQHPPIPGVHNSGWVQSPGAAALADRTQRPRLKRYVQGVIGAFAKDDRVLGWDLWNEPDNAGGGDYPATPNKTALVEGLIGDVFEWAREADPTQPLTSAVWTNDDWAPESRKTVIENVQLEQSDVISFHDYAWPETFERLIVQLESYGRPIICSEYMARGNGSTFDTILPIGRRRNVAMINWGFVDGKTQTRLPWDSWKKPYTAGEPPIWFHDVLRSDGTPYRQAEVDLIHSLRTAPRSVVPTSAAAAAGAGAGTGAGPR